MANSLTVGGVTALPGQLASGWIDVPEGVDAGTRIPVTVANGASPGPVLALVAGTHGSEYTSILALQRLSPRLEPARMRGAAILVHMANPPAFYGRRVYYGPDGKNLNRVYPGRADGTVCDRIADAITREVIERCTHLADMHCGDGNEWLRPYSYWIVGGDARVDAESRELALAYGLDHILVDRGRPRDPAASAFTANTAITRGKPAITTESGGLGRTDEPSVTAHEAGARSLLAHLGILDGPSARVAHPVWIDRAEVLRSPMAGLWHPVVEPMQSVSTGRLLGRVTDAFGAVLHEARAPFAGAVVYVVATPPVNAGEPLCEIGHLAETSAVA
jgi:predicted deacylase